MKHRNKKKKRKENQPSQGQTDLFIFPCAPASQPRESYRCPLYTGSSLIYYPGSHTVEEGEEQGTFACQSGWGQSWGTSPPHPQ